jgi:hypothetical protein
LGVIFTRATSMPSAEVPLMMPATIIDLGWSIRGLILQAIDARDRRSGGDLLHSPAWLRHSGPAQLAWGWQEYVRKSTTL